MTTERQTPPGFWRTVRLLLVTARRRSNGRLKRQRELLSSRAGKNATDWGTIGFVLSILFMAALNIAAAFALRVAVGAGQRAQAEIQGKIVVDPWFQASVENATNASPAARGRHKWDMYASEASRLASQTGGSREAIAQELRDSVRQHGTRDLISSRDAAPGLDGLPRTGPIPIVVGSIALLWWCTMLVFQGEGLELDFQKHSHPIWEWLFSHPVPTGAVFLAEILAPVAANPFYWGAPLFAGFVYGFVYGPRYGALAVLVVGVPVTVAGACLGKALEIGVMLRFPARTRGAMIGIMSWLGYASMMLLFVSFFIIPKLIFGSGKVLAIAGAVPWPWLSLFLGGPWHHTFSFFTGVVTCWTLSAVTTAAAVWFTVWGTQQGLSGNTARAEIRPSGRSKRVSHFGKEPLYRKEFLWFMRDRSAVVQVVLIPLTLASFQLFNLRTLLLKAQGEWNYLSGAAILFGTYFLWILGPKSLASEGQALWISLTWPRGLENLLKAKAWLWSLISTGVVCIVLAYAVFLFPHEIWKILLVAVGWFLFGRSMAEKAVTLVTVTSSSGEPERLSRGRRAATQLGMLTFSIGVLTQQWQIAIMGIVYSFITAAAMWENFRARLPYLYDPWSETLPPPPTLIHAMVAISLLAEGGAIVTAVVLIAAGRENLAIAQAISYGVCAVLVSIFTARFLRNRGVHFRDVWFWGPDSPQAIPTPDPWWQRLGTHVRGLIPSLMAGAGLGLALGLGADGYIALLRHIPIIAELLRKSQEQLTVIPHLRLSNAIMAVGFAPFAEEYLFRGLLYRALDREWGGWRAVAGSAAVFAVYHPPLSWLPVALLGATNAMLFKKTGRLASAVILHMVYNAVIVLS